MKNFLNKKVQSFEKEYTKNEELKTITDKFDNSSIKEEGLENVDKK